MTLLKKLEAYGIRGNILELLKSYLTGRKQVTDISRINIKTKFEEKFRSIERSTYYGVPQGSVLGPLLFILYINDLPKATNHPMTLFADDSTLTIACRAKETYETDINISLTNVINWLNNNNLKINIAKTKIMHFSQRIPAQGIQISYNSNNVDQVETAKFLGLLVDRQLNWKAHVAELCKKVSSASYALYKLAPIINRDALLTAYHGLAASTLRYGIIFWGNSTDFPTAFKAQKRCIRAMFGLQTTDSCKPYFTEYKILTLPALYIFEVSIFVRNNTHLFPIMSDFVTRNRRADYRCLVPSKTALKHKSLLCMAPKIYNKIPKSIQQLTFELFKKKLKHILTNKAYYTINEFLNDTL